MNWHHKVLCDYLEQWVSGRIKRLMVFMPSRHGKSELVSRRLPAWLFGREPDAQIIACSYSADLAQRMNRDVQRIMDNSTKYKEVFPNTTLYGSHVRTTSEGAYMRNSDLFEIVNHKGSYRGAGVGGGITGMGFNYGIIDDPIKNAEEAHSKRYRDAVWEWYTSTFYTRREKDARILLTATRWHDDDLPGRLMKLAKEDSSADQWTVLSLPAIAEEPLHERDPRMVGEALWKNKFDVKDLETTKSNLSEYQWAAMYQQRPRVPGGNVFLREWFSNRFDATDDRLYYRCVARWHSWDTALSDNESSAYAALTVGELMPDYTLNIREVWRAHLTFPDLLAEIEKFARRDMADGKLKSIIVEDKASGTSAIQTMKAANNSLSNLLVGFMPTRSKEERADQASIWCKNQSVFLPWPSYASAWLVDFEDEMFSFPGSEYKDQVDSFSQLILFTEKLLAAGLQARTAQGQQYAD